MILYSRTVSHTLGYGIASQRKAIKIVRFRTERFDTVKLVLFRSSKKEVVNSNLVKPQPFQIIFMISGVLLDINNKTSRKINTHFKGAILFFG